MPPRPTSSVEEILAITIELIAQRDVSGVTMDLVAERAGVSKPTLYRRWPSRDALILDAIVRLHRPGGEPGTGSIRTDLALLLRELVDFLNRPEKGKVHAAFLNAAVRNPELAALNRAETKKARSSYERAIKRAIERGELVKNTNIRLMIDMLISPFLYCRLVENVDARKADIHPVIDIVLAAFARIGSV